MKKYLFLTLLAGLLFSFAGIPDAEATKEICFCHVPPSPKTHCSSDPSFLNGHLGHGDVPFGCECGDGTCSPEFGEDCSTCPTDCIDDTDCSLCGDGILDEGEECGEPGLDCSSGACVGCRCLPFCGDGIIDTGEQCDGDDCCNDDCTLIDSEECGGVADGGADGTTDGGCEFVPQTGGNGFGCSRKYQEECAVAGKDNSSMLSFALLGLPTLALLPSLRSRRKKRR